MGFVSLFARAAAAASAFRGAIRFGKKKKTESAAHRTCDAGSWTTRRAVLERGRMGDETCLPGSVFFKIFFFSAATNRRLGVHARGVSTPAKARRFFRIRDKTVDAVSMSMSLLRYTAAKQFVVLFNGN